MGTKKEKRDYFRMWAAITALLLSAEPWGPDRACPLRLNGKKQQNIGSSPPREEQAKEERENDASFE